MVRMSQGQARIEAAADAAKELRAPLLTSSLTTAAAFLPIYLAESKAGEYTAPLFVVVSITLLASWLLSLTMIPLLCVRYLAVDAGASTVSFDSGFYVRYRRLLLTMLRRPVLTLGGVAIVFVGAMAGFGLVPQIFFPPNDRPTFTAELELPAGTPIARTREVVGRVDAFIGEMLAVSESRPEGVTSWASFVGEGAPRFLLQYYPALRTPEYAHLLVNATSRDTVDDLIGPLEHFANATFPDVKATIRPLDLGPPAWPPIEVRLSGRDIDRLFTLVDKVKEKVRSLPGAKLVDDNWGSRSKKLLVKINQPRARRAGVTNQDVAISLQTFLSGFETTEFREEDKIIPVTLRSVASQRLDIGNLESINVYAQGTGASVPLKQVADIVVVWEAGTIQRRDRMKTVTVEALLEPGFTAAAFNASLVPWLEEASASWERGYSWELGGETEKSGESRASIRAELPIAGVLIVLLLVGQFNSFRRPLIILITIPLGLIGVVVGLIVARSYFGFMTLLGIVSLAGIVINNAIVLLDRIKIEIEELGRSEQAAVIEAAQQRLRPILLTTATTVVGLIPLWLGGGPMFEPMAITIIFGLLFATILTLGVVPVLYAVLYRVSFGWYVCEPDGAKGPEGRLAEAG